MSLKLVFLHLVFSAVNANVLKGGEELDAHFEKRFSHFSTSWGKKTLTYAVDGAHLSNTMSEKDMYDGLEEAFNLWESVNIGEESLTFINLGSENYDQADIKIGFYTEKNPIDNKFFYGAGIEKAHAYAPGNQPYSGQIHFNGYQRWHYFREGDSIDNYRITNFAWVAAHEIGHALGLGHSVDENALMRPNYPGLGVNAELSSDDVEGLKDLFSPRGRCWSEEEKVIGYNHLQDCCNSIGFVFTSPKTISEKMKIIYCDEYRNNHPSNCPSGYFSGGDGTCQDINECYVRFYMNKLCAGKKCKNTEGSYRCE